jgi:hypothetical protein
MKNTIRWELLFGAGLILLAALLHFMHYLVFGEVSPLLSFLGKKIAFVPLEVLFITLILHRLLTVHERTLLKKKMNMLSGAFFSEMGNDLLKILKKNISIPPEKAELISVHKDWSKKDFDKACRELSRIDIKMETDLETLEELKKLLCDKRPYLMLMLGNPTLLEHESFSNMLWATFHLSDELSRRPDLQSLPKSDIKHLNNDAKRAFKGLLAEWFSHLRHLREEYPYLYSMELRINPFDQKSSVIIRQ